MVIADKSQGSKNVSRACTGEDDWTQRKLSESCYGSQALGPGGGGVGGGEAFQAGLGTMLLKPSSSPRLSHARSSLLLARPGPHTPSPCVCSAPSLPPAGPLTRERALRGERGVGEGWERGIGILQMWRFPGTGEELFGESWSAPAVVLEHSLSARWPHREGRSLSW